MASKAPPKKRQRKTKKSKPCCEDGVDLIGSLPDCLLSHILSFLPAADALRTCVLSSGWKHLFASNPALHLDDAPFRGPPPHNIINPNPVDTRKFVNFVYRVFLLRNGAPIDDFRLRCLIPYDIKHVHSWISAALRNVRVRRFELSIRLNIESPLLRDLFNCGTLVVLKLEMLNGLKVPNDNVACFPRLKVLHLSSLTFCSDGSASRLISACHVLEELRMDSLSLGLDSDALTISISTLRGLSAEFLFGAKLVLDTPNLEYLCIDTVPEGCNWRNLSSVAVARIELASVYFSSGQQVSSFLEDISKVERLHLKSGFREDIEFTHCQLPTFFKLTYLELTAYKTQALTILNLLQSLCTLKVLTLCSCYISIEDGFPERVPSCLSSELLEVSVQAFCADGEAHALIVYFLLNARVLKRMTINSCKSSSKNLFTSAKLLSQLPRLSQACVITLT